MVTGNSHRCCTPGADLGWFARQGVLSGAKEMIQARAVIRVKIVSEMDNFENVAVTLNHRRSGGVSPDGAKTILPLG